MVKLSDLHRSRPLVNPADAKSQQRLAPMMQRVLIVDPMAASVRLLQDLLRNIVPCQIWTAGSGEKGLALARMVDPQIIFCEYAGDATPTPAGCCSRAPARRGDARPRPAPD